MLGKPGKMTNTMTEAVLHESGLPFSATPTPEEIALAKRMERFTAATGLEGRQLKYISGDVVAQGSVKRYFPHVYEDALGNATQQAKRGGLSPRDFYSNQRTFPTLHDAIAAGKQPLDSVSEPFG